MHDLDPTDPQSRFDALADQIVTNLASPDIIAVREMQADNGPGSGPATGDQTWLELIDAIADAGGPAYDHRQIDPQARVGVAGDLNDFEFSAPVRTLESTGLTRLPAELPDTDRHTYIWEGNSQVLDHILLFPALVDGGHELDVVHTNAEFAPSASASASDHDPLTVRLPLP